MGRSVSVPRNAVAVAYADISEMGYIFEDEQGNELDEPEFSSSLYEMEFEDFKQDFVNVCIELFPSLRPEEKWLGDELLSLLENRLANFGISSYMDLCALWVCPVENDYNYSDSYNIEPLAQKWCMSIKDKFESTFGTLDKLGTFSNGEAIFKRKQN